MAKQSWFDRIKRLSDGRCPLHGIPMYQIDLEYIQLPYGRLTANRFIVQCPRKDCSITAFESEAFGEAQLFPQFKNLIS